MTLSDKDINEAIQNKEISITPQPTLGNTITGCAVDLRIGHNFRRFKAIKDHRAIINITAKGDDIKEQIEKVFDKEITLTDDEFFTLKSGEVILAHTLEQVEISENYVGIIEGKSSLARLGVEVHLTSNRINPGWKGQIVLEIANNGPTNIQIQPKAFFSAISFNKLSSPSQYPYNKTDNKYQNQQGAQTPQ